MTVFLLLLADFTKLLPHWNMEHVGVCMQVLMFPETRGSRVSSGYEWPDHGCWERNLGPLQEQTFLLTTELFLKSLHLSSL